MYDDFMQRVELIMIILDPVLVNGANGNTYYFRSIAKDNASNEESYEADDYDTYTAVVPGTLTVEITSPIDDDGDGHIYVKETITITGTASGANFSKYWLNYSSDGSSWLPIENSTIQVISGTLGTLNTSRGHAIGRDEG